MNVDSLNAVTVCVNYGDFLIHAVQNKPCFDRWMVVTVPEDEETVGICQDHDIEYMFSERLLMDGGFHKGKAINDALLELDTDGWVCNIDADTLLMVKAFNELIEQLSVTTDNIVGVHGRYQVDTIGQLKDFMGNQKIKSSELLHVRELIGFFQMWHTDRKAFYPEEWHHAGGDDITMRNSFHKTEWKFLPTYAVHLGPMFKNHKGRKSPRFE